MKSERERLDILLDTLNILTQEINDLLLKLKYNGLCENKEYERKRQVLYIKWKSVIEQAQTRIEQINDELDRLDRTNIKVN